VDGDTTINSIHYKKYFQYFDSLNQYVYAFLREDTIAKRIYAMYAYGGQEHLLYDFSAGIGDTITVSCLWQGGVLGMLSVKVANIDSILIDGNYRRRLALVNTNGTSFIFGDEYWIEGIGSTAGIFNSGILSSTMALLNGPYAILLFFELNGQLLYQDTTYNTCYMDELLVGFGQQDFLKSNFIQLFPNPTADLLNITYIHTTNTKTNIQIINSQGQIVREISENQTAGKQTTTIDIKQMIKGLYHVKYSAEKCIVSKIIIN
jgi:hypothetical protein